MAAFGSFPQTKMTFVQRRRRRTTGASSHFTVILHESAALVLVDPSPTTTTTTTTTTLSGDDIGEQQEDDYRDCSNPIMEEEDEKRNGYLPPWLKRLERYTHEDAMIHLDWLEYAMLEEHFSFQDVREVLDAVVTITTARNNNNDDENDDIARLVGTIDFLRLILQLKDDEEEQQQQQQSAQSTGDDILFCTKDVLLASILHYNDCITIRETGVYEMVRRAIHGRQRQRGSSGANGRRHIRALAPSSDKRARQEAADSSWDPEVATYDDDITRSLIAATRRQEMYSETHNDECYGEEVTRIARDAARVKRAEILAHAVLDVGRKPSRDEASRLRGLFLSVMDDWRALAIRAVACLYRLEGALHDAESGTADYVHLSPEVVRTTREALHVYAPLAQRLGMHRLKTKLEDRAFRIMYRRQYDVVSSLYRENGAEMALISSDLSSRMEMVLRQTPSLMEQLEDLKVVSRVKEPYSLWKKLLKLRDRRRMAKRAALLAGSLSEDSLVCPTESFSSSPDLSLFDVKDGIAVRVILRAKKWSPDESDETTRAREGVLCYYVQQLLRNYWPVVDKSRVKDYIRYPKPNGYQSLHYTSSINSEGQTWPFEVQVRSEEMHRIAEYGVASHWGYKLKGNKKVELLPPSADEKQGQLNENSDVIHQVDDGIGATATEDSYIDALVTARNDLVQQRVFVFFAGSSAIDVGQLLSLPVGAKVCDAISELKTQSSLNINVEIDNGSVLRNGRAAKPDEYVGNGDVILITL